MAKTVVVDETQRIKNDIAQWKFLIHITLMANLSTEQKDNFIAQMEAHLAELGAKLARKANESENSDN